MRDKITPCKIKYGLTTALISQASLTASPRGKPSVKNEQPFGRWFPKGCFHIKGSILKMAEKKPKLAI